MKLIRTIACCLLMCFYLPVSAQSTRWLLSFNPLGLLEPMGALGVVQRRFFGEALQLGFRRSLKEDMGLYIEFTAGLGIKQPVFKEKGIPAGYRHSNVDNGNGLEDGITPANIYAPGSIRLIWAFGKKL